MNKILFLDTLTTGLNSERCSIYRIGGIFCEETINGIKETKRFDLKMRPYDNARIVENSLWIGGETRSSLIYYESQEKAFKEFLKMIEETINLRNPKDKLYIAGFNVAAFDVPFIRNWFQKNSCPRFRDCFYVQTIDLISISAFALINDRAEMPDFHLESAAKALGIIPEKEMKYDCISNSITCIEIYKKLKSRLHTAEIEKHEKTEQIYRNYK